MAAQKNFFAKYHPTKSCAALLKKTGRLSAYANCLKFLALFKCVRISFKCGGQDIGRGWGFFPHGLRQYAAHVTNAFH
jgi:hypothetical protein